MCWDSFPCQQMRTLVWKLRMAKESHCIPLVSGSTFVIFRHHSWFPRSLFPCILTISTLFNNWKYFIFTDEWNIFSFSGAYILSTWIHDTHTLIVLSYKSPWAWQFPHITVCFKGPQCLLLVLTHCSSCSFPDTKAHTDFSSQHKGCFLAKPNLGSHAGSEMFQWFSISEVPFNSSLKHFASWLLCIL